jgi:hypothetical protein
MAQLVCFPQERNIGKARRVASVYLGKRTEKARSSYWGDTCNRLQWTMQRCGFIDHEIERQIQAFKWAVEEELDRLSQRGNGPGAA